MLAYSHEALRLLYLGFLDGAPDRGPVGASPARHPGNGSDRAGSSTATVGAALCGQWVGTLAYRDYSEPATSTKRVKLPTWLRVEAGSQGLSFHYVYDDGPAKVVTETQLVRLDVAAATYTVRNTTAREEEKYTIAGLTQLQSGRGTLVLTGPGTENDAPVTMRVTLYISRNLLEITQETAPPGQPFAFRDAYTLVHATAPSIPPAPKQ